LYKRIQTQELAHDPSIVERSDGTYFKFNTGSGIEIATASSIAGPWTYQGYALPSGSKISVTGNTGTDLWVRVASPELR
jgi:arabinan endo-1,5-alpha-L-arabinosidase